MIKLFEEFNFRNLNPFRKKFGKKFVPGPHFEIDPYGEDDWEEELDYTKKFVKFLNDNRAYDKFIHYLNRAKHIDDINVWCNQTTKENVLVHAFNWSSTPDGTDFWFKLHKDWLKLNKLHESWW
jgi:hypothetical protein